MAWLEVMLADMERYLKVAIGNEAIVYFVHRAIGVMLAGE